MESEASGPTRIAFAMADDYPWEVIHEQQLSDVEFEIWPDCLEWSEDELLERLRGVTAIVTGRKSPRMPDALIEDRGQLRAIFHCHGGVRQLVHEEHLRTGLIITNWGKNAGGSVAMGALVLMFNCLYQVRSLHEYAMSDKTVDGRIPQNYPCTLFGARIE